MKNFRFILALTVCAGLLTARTANADTIADLDADYPTGIAQGWSYLWNPTGATIGTAAGYESLSLTGDSYFTTASDPSNDFTNSGNDAADANARLQVFDNTAPNGTLDSVNWIIGGQNATGAVAATDALDHYVILGYTLQAGEAVGDLTLNIDGSSGAAGEYRAYLNDTLVDSTTYATNGNKDDTYTVAGAVDGDTIYLAWIGDSAQNRNTQRNFLDYNIENSAVTVPEPSSIALLGLGVMGLVSRRRR